MGAVVPAVPKPKSKKKKILGIAGAVLAGGGAAAAYLGKGTLSGAIQIVQQIVEALNR